MMEPTHADIPRNHAEWDSDFGATLSDDGRWSATHSFMCHSEDVITVMPSQGDACTEAGFEFLTFAGATTAKEGGRIARVVCRYTGTNNDNDFTVDDNGKTFEMSRSLTEEPIERNEKYYGNIDVSITAGIRDGSIHRYDEGDDIVIYYRGDNPALNWIEDVDELTDECCAYIVSGEDSFLSPRATWSASIPSKRATSSADLANFGYIDTPMGSPETPTDGDHNWLFIGQTQTKTGGVYDLSFSWELSSPRGWNEDFYTKPVAP